MSFLLNDQDGPELQWLVNARMGSGLFISLQKKKNRRQPVRYFLTPKDHFEMITPL